MKTSTDWIATVHECGPEFERRAGDSDVSGSFVVDNYETLKELGMLAAGIPADLGGGGATHAELCDLIRTLATYCPSTSLALSMHSHLVAATVWKHRHGKGGEPLLRKIVDEKIVLLSTGGSDWVDSNGALTRVEGGYRMTARKIFGSGSPVADVMVTSSRYHDPSEGWKVLHFPLSMRAEGVTITDDWDSCGMRGTGSNTILIEDAFIPDESIALERPAGQWHPVWSMVVTVAFPIFLAPYLGIAARARAMAAAEGRARWDKSADPHQVQLLGELDTLLMPAQLAWQDMIRRANDYEFEVGLDNVNRTLIQKSILTRACIRSVEKAIEATGGKGFHRSFGLERLYRDVLAGSFHPLPAKKQELFTGRLSLGLDPITAEALSP